MFSPSGLRSLNRLVLVWFALFVGVSIASPLVNPTMVDKVCSSGAGSKLVVIDLDGDERELTTSMDCPLCSASIPFHCAQDLHAPAPSSLEHALRPARAAHLASLTAPPLPSRGPPTV
ncbi:MAG: hypothetical protein EBW74_02745 [Betaproteobacteria bacterium]|nr:hypothetical protein [Betaproteobacteria bacterium]